jgi:hypothetical protein
VILSKTLRQCVFVTKPHHYYYFFFLFILYYLIAMCDVVLWEREVTFGTLADLPSMAEKLAVAQSIFE